MGGGGWGWVVIIRNKANSVRFNLPTGTELGNRFFENLNTPFMRKVDDGEKKRMACLNPVFEAYVIFLGARAPLEMTP